VAGATTLAIVLWFLSEILLLVFGSVLVAVMLRALAAPLSRGLRIGEGWSLALAGTCLVAVLIAAGALFGTTLSEQMRSLSEQLAYASDKLGEQLQLGSLTDLLKGTRRAAWA
jgi:predicted PurR-regulated permease PerM